MQFGSQKHNTAEIWGHGHIFEGLQDLGHSKVVLWSYFPLRAQESLQLWSI